MSLDGNYVAFTSLATNLTDIKDTNGVTDTWVFNRSTRINWRSSVTADRFEANGASSAPSVIYDAGVGLQQAYQTDATNIDRFPDTNNITDVAMWAVSPDLLPSPPGAVTREE